MYHSFLQQLEMLLELLLSFDYLLNNAQVVGTPGAGFGKNGEGFFRLTSFGSRENTIEAMDRFKKLFK